MEKLDKPAQPRRRLTLRPAMRVRRGSDFQRAYRRGNRARGANLIVVACPNGLEYSRLGLSVGKRIWKQAARRNRIRRVFREAFRLSYPDLPSGFDFILIPAAPRLRPRGVGVQQELTALGQKAVRRVLERAQKERADGEQPNRRRGKDRK